MSAPVLKPAARARQLAALWIARNLSDPERLALDAHPAEVAEVRRELVELAAELDREAARIERGEGPDLT